MDASFGNQGSSRGRENRDNGRNKLLNEVMSEIQTGMNMPGLGSEPVMPHQMGNGSMGQGQMGGSGGPGGPGAPMAFPSGGLGPSTCGPMGNYASGPAGMPMGNPIMGNDYPYPQTGYDMNQGYQSGQLMARQAGPPGQGQGGHYVREEEYEDDDGEQQTAGDDDDEPKSSKGMIDTILESGKEPLIGAIILMLILSPQFTSLFNQFLPKISENLVYSLLTKGLIFFVIFYLIQKYL